MTVSARQLLSAPPAYVRRRGTDLTVTAWAGPWTVDEQWWDSAAHRRLARLQVVVRTGSHDARRPYGRRERPAAGQATPGAGAIEGVYG